ncbi:MAG: oxidoreductase [Candidatus Meridianibacter frigidus]|nr:MAG: oxidoreductase [Candidatus Eremiobacteraeota bacterium]
MISKPLGSAVGPVSAIGQGTWDLPERGARRAEASRALLRGIELGMTHIDTAEMYGNGAVEEMLGDVLATVERSQLFVTTKVLPSNATFKGTLAACERSLKRLRMDHVDLYLLHWPGEVPVTETVGALEKLVDDGKTRFIGVSNFDAEELETALGAATKHPLVCNQVLYHLRERGMEKRVFPVCAQNNIAVVGYTPFGRGKFPAPSSTGGRLLMEIAQKHGRTVRQVMLNFLIHEPLLFAIPKASSVEHVEENAGGAGWELDPDDIERVNAIFPVPSDGRLATL